MVSSAFAVASAHLLLPLLTLAGAIEQLVMRPDSDRIGGSAFEVQADGALRHVAAAVHESSYDYYDGGLGVQEGVEDYDYDYDYSLGTSDYDYGYDYYDSELGADAAGAAPTAPTALAPPTTQEGEGRTKADNMLQMMVYWKITDLKAFEKCCRDFAELTKKEAGVTHYGFTITPEKGEAVCKEAYTGSAAFLAHLKNVAGPLEEALQVASITKIEAHGPKEEVDKLREPLKDFPVTYWEQIDKPFFVPANYASKTDPIAPDDTLSMMVHWTVKNSSVFEQGCADFTKLTKQEEGNKYYGFTLKHVENNGPAGDQAVCREGYVGADAFLTHLANVDEPLKAALKVADITKIEAHGPQAELDKLRGPLSDFPVTYWSYLDGAFYVPSKYT